MNASHDIMKKATANSKEDLDPVACTYPSRIELEVDCDGYVYSFPATPQNLSCSTPEAADFLRAHGFVVSKLYWSP